jgi:hypothetical protein
MRGRLGVERTMELTRRYFIPIGVAMWALMAAAGVYSLIAPSLHAR